MIAKLCVPPRSQCLGVKVSPRPTTRFRPSKVDHLIRSKKIWSLVCLFLVFGFLARGFCGGDDGRPRTVKLLREGKESVRIVCFAFSFCTSLTSVTIGTNVTSIGDSAFRWCTSLTNITIPDSVTNIGIVTFRGCTGLTSATIGNSVTSIGDFTFSSCTTLASVTIPDSVTSIGHAAFSGCTNLASVTIGSNVTRIGDTAFASCTSLTNITIPNSVTSIENSAFGYCTSLTNITIPNSVTNIGRSAFDYCTSLTAITVDGLNSFYSSVDGVLFNKSTNTLILCPEGKAGSYPVPDSVTNIGDRAFYSCASLSSVTIPDSVTSIGYAAFSSCTSLTGVYFQGNAPGLGGLGVFSDANSVTVYYLPGKTGWGPTFGGRPTALWLPQMLTNDESFGVRTNQFGFNISWASGMAVAVDACTSIANPVWTPLQTNTLTTDTLYFSDPQWANYPNRFYRLRWP
jgi:hypothetical protein